MRERETEAEREKRREREGKTAAGAATFIVTHVIAWTCTQLDAKGRLEGGQLAYKWMSITHPATMVSVKEAREREKGRERQRERQTERDS